MKDAQKPDHVSLNTLISRMKEGRFVVPDFQREFEWRPWDIRDLIRSIFLDYYIGSLLLWKAKPENYTALSCEPLYGHTGSARPEYIVLDGQQRLTAMYHVFLSPEKNLPGSEVYRRIRQRPDPSNARLCRTPDLVQSSCRGRTAGHRRELRL